MADPKNGAASDNDATEFRMGLALGLRGPAGRPVQQRADQAHVRRRAQLVLGAFEKPAAHCWGVSDHPS